MLGRFLEQTLIKLEAERDSGRNQFRVIIAFERRAARSQGVAQFVDGHPLDGASRSQNQYTAQDCALDQHRHSVSSSFRTPRGGVRITSAIWKISSVNI